MPQIANTSSEECTCKDEVKVYNEEGEEEDEKKRSSENLSVDKVDLVTEGEDQKRLSFSDLFRPNYDSVFNVPFADYLFPPYATPYASAFSQDSFGSKVPFMPPNPSTFGFMPFSMRDAIGSCGLNGALGFPTAYPFSARNGFMFENLASMWAANSAAAAHHNPVTGATGSTGPPPFSSLLNPFMTPPNASGSSMPSRVSSSSTSNNHQHHNISTLSSNQNSQSENLIVTSITSPSSISTPSILSTTNQTINNDVRPPSLLKETSSVNTPINNTDGLLFVPSSPLRPTPINLSTYSSSTPSSSIKCTSNDNSSKMSTSKNSSGKDNWAHEESLSSASPSINYNFSSLSNYPHTSSSTVTPNSKHTKNTNKNSNKTNKSNNTNSNNNHHNNHTNSASKSLSNSNIDLSSHKSNNKSTINNNNNNNSNNNNSTTDPTSNTSENLHVCSDHSKSELMDSRYCKSNHHKDSQRPHIKKPLNAFMLFMKEMRQKVQEECTLKESAAINQILGKKWHTLSKEEQSKYYEIARKEKQLHIQLFPEWSARDNYAIHSKHKKRRRLGQGNCHDGSDSKLNDANSMKKCRARYGIEQMSQWCKPCRRKKKCIRFLKTDESNSGATANDKSNNDNENNSSQPKSNNKQSSSNSKNKPTNSHSNNNHDNYSDRAPSPQGPFFPNDSLSPLSNHHHITMPTTISLTTTGSHGNYHQNLLSSIVVSPSDDTDTTTSSTMVFTPQITQPISHPTQNTAVTTNTSSLNHHHHHHHQQACSSNNTAASTTTTTAATATTTSTNTSNSASSRLSIESSLIPSPSSAFSTLKTMPLSSFTSNILASSPSILPSNTIHDSSNTTGSNSTNNNNNNSSSSSVICKSEPTHHMTVLL